MSYSASTRRVVVAAAGAGVGDGGGDLDELGVERTSPQTCPSSWIYSVGNSLKFSPSRPRPELPRCRASDPEVTYIVTSR